MRTAVAIVTLALAVGCGGAGAGSPRHETSTAHDADGTACPENARERGRSEGGLCLDESVFGRDAVSACGTELAEEGWVHDDVAESTIRESTGLPVVCYHVP